jgi:hypothetical protein
MPETASAPSTRDDTRQPLLDELPFPRTGAANGTRLSRRLEIIVGDRTLAHLMRPPLRPLMKRLPSLLGFLSKRIGAHPGRWASPNAETPPELRSVPEGIRRDPQAEEAAYREAPLGDFLNQHPVAFGWVFRRMWPTLLPILPPYYRARQRVATTLTIRPTSQPKLGPEELTALVKSEATRVGMSAVGIAPFDPKYIFSEYQDSIPQGSVIVCVLEQNWEATQTIPSVRGERAAFATYVALMEQMNELAGVLHRLGHRAEVSTPEGRGVVIHYGWQQVSANSASTGNS